MRNPHVRPLNLLSVCCVVLLFAVAMPASAQTKLAKSDSVGRVKVLKVSASSASATKVSLDSAARANLEKHPLWPALEIAVKSYKHIRRDVRDYSCNLVRQERVNGRLLDAELMTAKVRHQRSRNGKVVIPFGVYLKVLGPAKVKGREVLYVDGQNDGEMFVRNGGRRFAYIKTTLKPDSETAMNGNRYPLTEFGFENLVKRLIEVVKADIRSGVETEVEFFSNATINGRSCTGIRVTHPAYDSNLLFHKATVFMDNELNVPVHYEAYAFPKKSGEKSLLLEKYTYRDIKLNVGYTDGDFDPANPNYKVK